MMEEFETIKESLYVHNLSTLFRYAPNRGDLIWHYTNAAGFEGILRDGAFHATHGAFVNDPDELSFRYQRSVDVFQDILRGITDDLFRGHVKRAIEDFQTRFLGNVLHYGPLYSASFSRARNSLGQWRAYASNGSGFALGLDWYEVVETIDKYDSAFSSSNNMVGLRRYIYRPYPVLYDYQQQHDLVLNYMNGAYETGEKHRALIETSSDNRKRFEDLVRISLTLIAHCFKGEGFAEEQELRFVALDAPDEERQIRIRGETLVPFVHFPPLGAARRLPIKEVIIGPSAVYEKAKYAAEVLLSLHGYDVREIKILSPGIRLA